jgi:hypothetical protein
MRKTYTKQFYVNQQQKQNPETDSGITPHFKLSEVKKQKCHSH